MRRRNIPDVLRFEDGNRVATEADWSRRKKEILYSLQQNEYGIAPGEGYVVEGMKIRENKEAFGGKAFIREVSLQIVGKDFCYPFPVYEVLPKTVELPPSFVYISFEPNVLGTEYGSLPVEEIVDRGYALVCFWYQSIAADLFDYFNNGICSKFARNAHTSWGKLLMWAWGASRVMDYLQTSRELDTTKIGVLGCSRLGKAALLAGAQDERFSSVFAVDSGAGGAALFRGKKGERIADLVEPDRFPYWFCGKFAEFAEKEETLPFDQHFLLSLIAPRSLYIASAEKDDWADPVSEFLGAYAASPVYEFLGAEGLLVPERFPRADDVFHGGMIGYHMRRGVHGINRDDWNNMILFRNSKKM